MTISLVTGHAGTPHVTAAQDAGLHAGIIGLDDYVLDMQNKFAITVVSANKVTIGSGELVMQGYHVSNDGGEDLIISNGSQGMKRNDLIVCRYEKGSESVESASLVVVKGEATTGTAKDPAINTTSMWKGGTVYDMPLYRIPLNGITLGTPVPLFNIMQPMKAVWDSLSHTGPITLINGGHGGNKVVTGVKWGRFVQLNVSIGSKLTPSWAKETIGTLPVGWRPAAPARSSYGRDGKNQMDVVVYADGKVAVENQGGSQTEQGGSLTVCYFAA